MTDKFPLIALLCIYETQKRENMNKLAIILIVVLVHALIAGCASIISGTDQTMTFNSEPDGATVTVSGLVIGKTPLSVQINKGTNQSLTFEKEGYKKFTTQLSTSMDGWFWGNIVFGGLLGSTTDGVSGAIHEFSPDQYFVTLTPDNGHGLSSSKPRKIKELVIAFGSQLRAELVAGGGETTSTIISLLGIEPEAQGITITVLEKLSQQNKNDLNFALRIIEFYDVK